MLMVTCWDRAAVAAGVAPLGTALSPGRTTAATDAGAAFVASDEVLASAAGATVLPLAVPFLLSAGV